MFCEVTSASNRHGWQPTADLQLPTKFQHLMRSKLTNKTYEIQLSEMPRFYIANQTRGTDNAVASLFEAEKKLTGDFIAFLLQKTGSCVGNGYWNAVMRTMANEIVRGDFERLLYLFMPYSYGRGRKHSGINGRGEGSIGSGQAKAGVEDGNVEQTDELPKYSGQPHALTWGSSVEMEWSDGGRIASKWIDLGRKHKIKTAAPITSFSQACDAIANGYGITVASMRGFQMQPTKDRGRWWGRPSGQWAHQMAFLACDASGPRPGLYDLNSWGADAHMPNELRDQWRQHMQLLQQTISWQNEWGDVSQSKTFSELLRVKGSDGASTPKYSFLTDDLGCPIGPGFWVDADVVDSMLRQNDSFAFSNFDGFPEQDNGWMLI